MLALEAAQAHGRPAAARVLLADAIRHAREGFAVTRSQAQLTAEKLAELKDVPGFAADIPGRRQGAGGRAPH